MFCPNCGQERVSTETKFCLRCGFLLTGPSVSPAAGNWRDTNDLEPRSVTEGTTKLLENDEISQ